MSKLKINDLSFCETELDNDRQLKGGISLKDYLSLRFRDSRFLFPFEESQVELLEDSVGEKGEKIRYFYDNETDTNGVIVSKETANGKVFSGVAEGNVLNGKFVSSFAFATS